MFASFPAPVWFEVDRPTTPVVYIFESRYTSPLDGHLECPGHPTVLRGRLGIFGDEVKPKPRDGDLPLPLPLPLPPPLPLPLTLTLTLT